MKDEKILNDDELMEITGGGIFKDIFKIIIKNPPITALYAIRPITRR